DGDQFFQGLEQKLLVHPGNAHAFIRFIQSFKVFFRSEQENSSILGFISFHSFKNRLGVMENRRRRIQCQRLVRNDARIIPTHTLFVIHYKHMICKSSAENELVVRYFWFGRRGVSDGYVLTFHKKTAPLFFYIFIIIYLKLKR